MYDDGYRNVSNLDYSAVVIDKMARANEGCDGMTWTVGDVRHLPFERESIDVCIDKATLDAMLTGEKDPWVRRSVLLDLLSHELFSRSCRAQASSP